LKYIEDLFRFATLLTFKAVRKAAKAAKALATPKNRRVGLTPNTFITRRNSNVGFIFRSKTSLGRDIRRILRACYDKEKNTITC
jgi:hypothetical protein